MNYHRYFSIHNNITVSRILLLLTLTLATRFTAGASSLSLSSRPLNQLQWEVDTNININNNDALLMARGLEQLQPPQHATTTDTPPVTKNVTCQQTGETVVCDGVTYTAAEQTDDAPSQQFFIDLSVSIGLTLFAGLMSGLTMGLMSIDLMNLQILINGGSPSQKAYAKRILPLVKRHHLVLVTLLIWDAAAVEALPLFLDRLVGTIIAIVISVTLIVLFGEIIPQAVCTRFGLAIGGYLFWLVWILIIIILPIAWPISKLLDWILGGSHGTFFRRAELKELVHLHKGGHATFNGGNIQGSSDGGGGGGTAHYDEETGLSEDFDDGLTADEVTIIHGALDMKLKTVRDAMTPIDSVFMLDVTETMGERTMDKLIQEGYSRVPVYRKSRQNILGMLLVKSLIKLNPADEVPIMDLEIRKLPVVNADMHLFDMLNLFQRGHSHMAVIVDPTDHITILGIITMEDVIEELIQEEIIDETDLTAIHQTHQPTLGIATHVAGDLQVGPSRQTGNGGGNGGGGGGERPPPTPHTFILRSSRPNVPTRVAQVPERNRSERILRTALRSALLPPAGGTGAPQDGGEGVVERRGPVIRRDRSRLMLSSTVPATRGGEDGEGGGGTSHMSRSPAVPIARKGSSHEPYNTSSYTDPGSPFTASITSTPPPTTTTTTSNSSYTPIPDGGGTTISETTTTGGGGMKQSDRSQSAADMSKSSHVIPTRPEKRPLLPKGL